MADDEIEYTFEQLRGQRLDRIQRGCSERIYQVYPRERQFNVSQLLAKFDDNDAPAGNYTEVDRDTMNAFIDAVRVRAHSYKAQAMAATVPEDLPAVDYSDITPG